VVATFVTGLAVICNAVASEPLVITERFLETGWNPRAGQQYAPAVAFNGSEYLAVWRDVNPTNGSWLYGARVSREGVVLEPSGIPILPYNQEARPAIAGNAEGYLVVWCEPRSGSASGSDVLGLRLSPSGQPLDPGGFLICGANGDQTTIAVAASSTNFLVVWRDMRSGNGDIYGARITSMGVNLDPQGLPICTTTNEQRSPAVTCRENSFLVAWSDDRGTVADPRDVLDIYGTLVMADGSVSSSDGFAISTASGSQTSVSVASSATGFFAAWEDRRNVLGNPMRRPPDLYGTRISAGGTVLDPGGIALATTDWDNWSPVVVSDLDGFFVAHTHIGASAGRFLLGVRISNDGVVSPTWRFITESPIHRETPFLVSAADDGEGNALFVWEDDRDTGSSNPDIYGARIRNGEVLERGGIPISAASNDQRAPVAAFDGEHYLTVWEDFRNPTNGIDIYGIRLDALGNLVDAEPFLIAAGPHDETKPAISFDGSQFVVVWRDGAVNDFFATRVSTNGVVMDRAPLRLSTGGNANHRARIASSQNGNLIVWDTLNSYDIYGTILSKAGTFVTTNPVPIGTRPTGEYLPSVASDGHDFLVVWEDIDASGARPSGDDIMAARVSEGGLVLDTPPTAVCMALGSQQKPSVAWNGTNYIVVWEDYRDGRGDITSSRVTAGGEALDPDGRLIAGASEGDWKYIPLVVPMNASALVFWVRWGSDATYSGSRITATGDLLNATSFTLWGTEFVRELAVAKGPFDDLLLLKLDTIMGMPRVKVKILTFEGPPLITSVMATNQYLAIAWSATPGRIYQLQYRTDPQNGAWLNVGEPVFADSVAASRNDNTAGRDPQRFYRVARVR